MKMARYDCIIWDWNGTLMDDAWLCIDVMNALLEARGMPTVDMDFYRENFDFPVELYYQRLGFDEEKDPFHVVSHEFIDNYNARRHECGLFPGAAELLTALDEAGQRMALLSAYKHDTLESIIAHYGLCHHFEHLSGNDNIYARGKSERAHGLIEKLGVEPSRTLLIGDTLHDYEVAVKVGADCLLVGFGYHGAARLASTGAPIAHTLEEIQAFVA